MPIDRLPTELELRSLTSTGVITYAIRCARRVQPLCDLWEDHPERLQLLKEIEVALSTINPETTHIEVTLQWAPLLTRAAAARAVNRYSWEDADAANIAGVVARAVASVNKTKLQILQAFKIRKSARLKDPKAAKAALLAQWAASDSAYDASKSAAEAANSAPDTIYNAVLDASWRDFRTLQNLKLMSEADFDPQETGPLGSFWPVDLEPEWYRPLREKLDEVLDLSSRPSVSPTDGFTKHLRGPSNQIAPAYHNR